MLPNSLAPPDLPLGVLGLIFLYRTATAGGDGAAELRMMDIVTIASSWLMLGVSFFLMF